MSEWSSHIWVGTGKNREQIQNPIFSQVNKVKIDEMPTVSKFHTCAHESFRPAGEEDGITTVICQGCGLGKRLGNLDKLNEDGTINWYE